MGDQQHTSQISSSDQVSYLFLKLETILSVVPMILVKLAILILVSLVRVGLNFPGSLHKIFIFDLYEHLSYKSIERR